MKCSDIISQGNDSKDIFGKKTPTIKALAKKYNVLVSEVIKQVNRGIKIEKEHTGDEKYALEIALDHLGEDLQYYIKLAKMEKD
jgi:hypothetical protein